MVRQGSSHFEVLDGLRGIAALSIALGHCARTFGFAPWDRVQLTDFFFVLSGFVMGRAYESKIRSGLTFRSFAKIRLIRIYPLVFLGVSLGLAARLIEGEFSTLSVLGATVFALLMLPLPRIGEVGASSFPLNGPLWSITFELISNSAYVLAAPALTTRRLILFTLTMIVGLAAYCSMEGGVWQNGGWNMGLLWGVVRVLVSFSIGLLIFRAYDHLDGKWPKVPGALPGAILAGLLFMIGWLPIGRSGLSDFLAITTALPMIVAAGLMCRNATRLSPVWGWLGTISYPLYAIHQPIFNAVRDIARPFGLSAQQNTALTVLSFGGTVILAHLAVRFYDEPIRAWLRAHFRKPSDRQAVPASAIAGRQ